MIYKEIQGLRVIAIFLVFFYHLNIPFFNQGYLGVDIFFILSGIIFSKILTFEFNNDKFSFYLFINKRVNRLFPALFLVLFSLLIVCWLFFTPQHLKYFGASLFSTAFFSSNFFYLIVQHDYFSSNTYILQHLWSLSLEFQFYLFYSILFYFVHKIIKQKKNITNIIYLLFYISFFLNLLYKDHESLIFYLIPFRLWEFLIGYFIFIYIIEKKKLELNLYIIFLILFFCLVFGSSEFITKQILMSLLIFILFALSFNTKNFINFFLTNDLFFNLAKSSYCFFIVHFPVIELIKYFEILNSTLYNILLAILVSIFVTFFIVKYEKLFFEYGKKKLNSISFLNFNLKFFLIISVSFFFYYTEGVKARIDIFQNLNDKYFLLLKNSNRKKCLEVCKLINGEDSNILLLGDSHASDFQDTLVEYAHLNKINLFLKYYYQNDKKIINQFDDLKKVLDKEKIDKVLIIHHVRYNFDEYYNDLTEVVKNNENINFFYFTQRLEFMSSPVKVKILNNNNFKINSYLLEEDKKKMSSITNIKLKNFFIFDQNQALLRITDKSCIDMLCFDAHDSQGLSVYSDNHHLNNYGAKLLFNEFLSLI